MVKRTKIILKISERISQFEGDTWKNKKSKKKDSPPGKKSATKKKYTVLLTTKRSGEKVDGCAVDHSDYVTSYEQETNRRYCMENNDLYGVICDLFKK